MTEQKPEQNRALRMLGVPNLPKKLPSRNWLIFWGVSATLTAAIIYDSREKRKATARWAAFVAPLAKEIEPNPCAMPRKITIFLEAPPGDGLRAAQDHFKQYIKPVLASSGLDWEFAVGRRQGDVRAVVAEKIRRIRRATERDLGISTGDDEKEEEDLIATIRQRNGTVEYNGVKGDIVVGRHTWKEYVRGLHEGWLGPLTAPTPPESQIPVPAPSPDVAAETLSSDDSSAVPTADKVDGDEPPKEDKKKDETAEKKKQDEKPKRPPQPPPYNTPDQYPSSPLPRFIPAELGPSIPISYPNLLGFFNTPIRIYRFLNRRKLADSIGHDVAAACLAVGREYHEDMDGAEQQSALLAEESDWMKRVLKSHKQDEKERAEKAEKAAKGEKDENGEAIKIEPPKEQIWSSAMVLDSRIADRMRRFVLEPAQEEKARQIVVPEEEIEGWTKGKLRQLGRWTVKVWKSEKKGPELGDLDSDD